MYSAVKYGTCFFTNKVQSGTVGWGGDGKGVHALFFFLFYFFGAVHV